MTRPATPGRAGLPLAAPLAPLVVGQHLGDAAARPAPRRRREPEVPVLRRVDEARVVATDVRPELTAVERGHVHRAADEKRRQGELPGAPRPRVLADEADPGVRDAERRVVVEERHGAGEVGRCQVVVGVERQDVGTPCVCDGRVPGRRRPAVLGAVDGHAGTPRHRRERGPGGRVGRAVVDDHDLEVAVGLRHGARDRALEIRAGVEDGDDDRDARGGVGHSALRGPAGG